MKRVSLFLITVVLIVGLVDCTPAPTPTPTRYNLTMAVAPAGSGNATDLTNASPYAAGTVVNIMAVPAVGYQFVNWTALVGTVANANAAQTTFTMPARYATVTADFAPKAAEIRTWYDLDAIRDNLGGNYILMNDLNSSTAGYEELASATANGGKGWQPIGSFLVSPTNQDIVDAINAFTGSLDGQGYQIRDLFVNRPDEDGVGLFGSVGWGVIKNLGVVNVAVAGHWYVGGLVGGNHQAGSYVTNSYSTGSVTGEDSVGGLVGNNAGTVTNSYSTGSMTGSSWAGGLVGSNWGTVSNSYSTGSVTGESTVGGLVGWQHYGTISNSYSTGSVTGEESVGGLVGETHSGTVSNSYYNYDEVLINSRNIITIGGLFSEDFDHWLANNKFLDVNERLSQENGYYLINDVNDFKQLLTFSQNASLKFRLKNDVDLSNDPDFYIPYLAGEFDGNGHTISNLSLKFNSISQVGLFGCLVSGGVVTGVGAEDIDITGDGIVGGLVGENDGTVTNSYVTGRIAGYRSVGGLVGWMGWISGAVSNSYYNYDEVLINSKNMITIGALFSEDFDHWLANNKFLDVNERLSQENGYYLINDVNDFKQLLTFSQNASLKFRLKNDVDLSNDPDFYIPYLAGEFDGNGHTISNLSLKFNSISQVGLFGCLVSGGKVSGVGVENVDIAVTSAQGVGGLAGGSAGTVSNSYSTGSVTGGGSVGGLVGWNNGTVSNSYSSGSVTGDARVGGLVGWNVARNNGTVSNSYSTGSVTGGPGAAGLVGLNKGTVTSSFWDTETSAQATSDGGTGKTTTEMKTIATFSGAGWNIIAVANPSTRNPSCVWNIVDGQTYPFLSWQATLSDTLQVQDVTSQEAFELIQENHGNPDFIILDVRTSLEFHDGHIEGALNIDVNLPSFSQELEQLDRNDTYLVYCRSGNRSRTALGIMEELGFTRIYHLTNGITEWVDAGLPVSQ